MSKRKSSSHQDTETGTDAGSTEADNQPPVSHDDTSTDATDATASAEALPPPDTTENEATATTEAAKSDVPDPAEAAETVESGETEKGSDDQAEAEPVSGTVEGTPGEATPPTDEAPPESSAVAAPKKSRSWFGLFNFLLILALAGAAGYYWQEQQKIDAAYRADIAELRAELRQKANASAVDSALQAGLQSSMGPLEAELGNLSGRIDDLGSSQQNLRESTETLYELFGRDRADWQLAEVEYLMRVAQHQLILQHDFEGAAVTLQAASDRIGLTGDPGLLPVRVRISEEIAELKTRRRPDLVGMTLTLAQLGHQVRVLNPGFALRTDEVAEATATEEPLEPPSDLETVIGDDWMARFNQFVDSLVTVRKESSAPTEIEANVIDIASVLEDNLKLARWAVLDRDGRQYQLLMERTERLFREFYDLDNAANFDFLRQLQELQKMQINPEKPDITGSLREMQRILSQRENEPEAVTGEGNG